IVFPRERRSWGCRGEWDEIWYLRQWEEISPPHPGEKLGAILTVQRLALALGLVSMGRFYLLPVPLPLACLRANRKCSPYPTPPRAPPHPSSWGAGTCVRSRLRGLGRATPGSGRSKGQPLPRLFPASRRPRDREQASAGPPLSSAAAHFPLAVRTRRSGV
ncbi:hypothetical protein Celaphus_00018937, partial [Cervus elaphus hippelaphus]